MPRNKTPIMTLEKQKHASKNGETIGAGNRLHRTEKPVPPPKPVIEALTSCLTHSAAPQRRVRRAKGQGAVLPFFDVRTFPASRGAEPTRPLGCTRDRNKVG